MLNKLKLNILIMPTNTSSNRYQSCNHGTKILAGLVGMYCDSCSP